MEPDGDIIWSLPMGGRCLGEIAVDSEERMYLSRLDQITDEEFEFHMRCVEKDQTLRWELPLQGIALYPTLIAEGMLLVPSSI